MRLKLSYAVLPGIAVLFAMPAMGANVYYNLTPTNAMAMASRPNGLEIEAADDFVLGAQTFINKASFVGLMVGGTSPSVAQLVVEFYRVFPLDSTNPPNGAVPTRANSPSDNAFDSRDSGTGQLTFSTSVLSVSFTALNSVLNGINPIPNQTTLGEGPVTGQEVEFDVTFTTPFNLPADHYFFIPQVALSSGQFYWLSGQRPILAGPPTTPFSPDLQAWIRNGNLDPNWLRVGTDIVGGTTPPTFNGAFSLDGTVVPEPSSVVLVVAGLAICGIWRRRVGRA